MPAYASLAAVQAAVPDTVLMVPARDPLAVAESVAVILIAVFLLALLAVLVLIGLKMRSIPRRIGHLLEVSEERMAPVMERMRSVSENVDYMSHAIRKDVEGLTESVDRIRRRLDDASDRVEERIQEFNALLDVVQNEAEEIFVDTASTVRGVRAGSKKLTGGRPREDGEGEV